MPVNIAETFELLFDKNNNIAYKALQELQKESEETDCVYAYMDRLGDMLDSDNSYIRTRGLVLLAYNARWDIDHKIDEIIDEYLKHITDVKPITARQCIKLLSVIAREKPELRNDICSALQKADVSFFDDSMQPLVYKDMASVRNGWCFLCGKGCFHVSGQQSVPAGGAGEYQKVLLDREDHHKGRCGISFWI